VEELLGVADRRMYMQKQNFKVTGPITARAAL